MIFAVEDPEAKARIVEAEFASRAKDSIVSVPVPGFARVGDACPLTEDTVLLSGGNAAGAGLIAVVKLVDSAVSVTASELPGVSPWTLLFRKTAQRIFFWEDATKRFKTAAWRGVGTPLPKAADYARVAQGAMPRICLPMIIELRMTSPKMGGARVCDRIGKTCGHDLDLFPDYDIKLVEGAWAVRKVR